MLVDEAHDKGVCIFCGKPIDDRIFSETGLKEYEISAVCEICFDELAAEDCE